MPQPIPKFKIGDIVTIKPYTGNSNSIHNIKLSKGSYEEVRLKGKATIQNIQYSPTNVYGNVYYLDGTSWIFHESVLLRGATKIRY